MQEGPKSRFFQNACFDSFTLFGSIPFGYKTANTPITFGSVFFLMNCVELSAFQCKNRGLGPFLRSKANEHGITNLDYS